MYLYYDKNGVLKEIVNDEAIRQYDASHTAFVYKEKIEDGKIKIEDGVYKNGCSLPLTYQLSWIMLEDGRGKIERKTSLIQSADVPDTPKSIPFERKRDLKFFKYGVKYEFVELPLGEQEYTERYWDEEQGEYVTSTYHFNLIEHKGDYKLSIREALRSGGTGGNFLGNFVFTVEDSGILPTENVTVSEFGYLLHKFDTKAEALDEANQNIATAIDEIDAVKETLDATVATATVETLSPGQSATVTASVDFDTEEKSGTFTFAFGIPKGQSGQDGAEGPQGPAGVGVTFTPSVSNAGVISWTNDGDLPNPTSRNIAGRPVCTLVTIKDVNSDPTSTSWYDFNPVDFSTNPNYPLDGEKLYGIVKYQNEEYLITGYAVYPATIGTQIRFYKTSASKISGANGQPGVTGKSALWATGVVSFPTAPSVGYTWQNASFSTLNRTPDVNDTFIALLNARDTDVDYVVLFNVTRVGNNFDAEVSHISPVQINQGLIPGGTTGQILAKKSNTDYDVEWQDASSSGGEWGSITGNISNQSDLSSALSGKVNTSDVSNIPSSNKVVKYTNSGELIVKTSGETASSAVSSNYFHNFVPIPNPSTDVNKYLKYIGNIGGTSVAEWASVSSGASLNKYTFTYSKNAALPIRDLSRLLRIYNTAVSINSAEISIEGYDYYFELTTPLYIDPLNASTALKAIGRDNYGIVTVDFSIINGGTANVHFTDGNVATSGGSTSTLPASKFSSVTVTYTNGEEIE